MILQKIHKTNNNSFNIQFHHNGLSSSRTITSPIKFSNLCQNGCKNYNKKYSCPPHSPSFETLKKIYSHIHVFALRVDTAEFPKTYNTIRMINIVIKSIQRKLFDQIEKDLTINKISNKILENGSCRLCKKCGLQSNLPCRYPFKMRPSLEATGIDVNQLMIDSFNFPLQWYSKNSFPEYQCVAGAILVSLECDEVIKNSHEIFIL